METKEMNMNELEQVNGGKDVWYYLIPNGNPSQKLVNLANDAYDLYKDLKKQSEEDFRKALGQDTPNASPITFKDNPFADIME